MTSRNESLALGERAQRVMPGGVSSPARAFRRVGGAPLYIARATGSRVVDEDGVEYVDFVMGWGALLFGHSPPFITEAIARAQDRGVGSGVPTRTEVEFAERLIDRLGWPDQVRLMNSGTEAVMTAVRLARGVTGRAGIVRFAGGYHGHSDAMLVADDGTGRGQAEPAAGLTSGLAREAWIARYNDLADVERILSPATGAIAAVIVEPVAANMGVVRPADGFLQGLRALCDASGVLLIFDEVVTGLRVGSGFAPFDVVPDLATYGKVIGGGMPVGAVAGRRELMGVLAPEGAVMHAGTFAGHPITAAAGLAVIGEIERAPDVYARLDELGAALEAGLTTEIARRGYPCVFSRAGSMWTLFFDRGPVTDWDSARRSSAPAFARFFHAMLANGVHLAPSPLEANFLSAAHTHADVQLTIAAATAALAEVYEHNR